MSNYSDLYQMIKLRVCQNNDIPVSSLMDRHSYRINQVWYRIGQIFTLECVLDEYRKLHASEYYPLENEAALHHMIFHMTKWKLEYIRELTLNDSLFIISERLKSEHMPAEAVAFLEKVNCTAHHYPIDEFPAKDWAPRENSVYLRPHS
ncbi:hypothetical protein [Shimwellia blattae]|uniref:Uncharacterized protein n=1 Tax=Shimwellia blattae (strain ATCC 29907 / DSM 4481 / JCM 1650 / NBRC 105725 / CDC 9005-74) TaxID=630626 RepID=I2B9F7_SHIBC|nr:hypothetical protein [Shimwellia blattae]AFJ47161.1 hypothetical protein EBL_c20700 [Shimwellia blattae DSM 4481 = NBRC 105725]GAB80719.1 hypothetical protein EB105725_08_00030 [Shimwellia blattae DSM 4481 = NBRC 105725]VDY64653.1 Uncharacterised protein [Shimwellia blattae]VEC22760.1 Uncharacterised protein [Shimwellia blattae]